MAKNKNKGQRQTAAQLLGQLAADARYRQQHEGRQRQRAIAEAMLAEDEETLVADLENAGVAVDSVWDLVNADYAYADAIPVLLRHLQLRHHLRTREGIVRALTVPEARGVAFPVLYEQFLATSSAQEAELKWLLGAALAEATTSETASVVRQLLTDKDHGKAREMLVPALQWLAPGERDDAIQALSGDPDIGKAIEALRSKLRGGRRGAT